MPNSVKLLNLPDASNPLILNIKEHVPSLKNNKQLVTRKDGRAVPVSNADVQHFVARIHGTCSQQVERQGFDRIPYPTMVAMYAEFFFYVANASNISSSDADNAMTTVQEVLQPTTKKHPYYLGVLGNDKLVVSPKADAYAVRERHLEGARVFVWCLNPELSRWDDWDIFKEFYLNYSQPTVIQEEIDFNVLDLL